MSNFIQLSLFDVDEFLEKSCHPYNLARISENFLSWSFHRLFNYDIGIGLCFFHKNFELKQSLYQVVNRYSRDEFGYFNSHNGCVGFLCY